MDKVKLLDCTLRDGGYYTNWDFDKVLVRSYCRAMESLPIDYIEIGYRSINTEGYLGKYFYCPDFVMKELKEMMPSKKLVVLLNEKETKISDLKNLLDPCVTYIDMVRIAVIPDNFQRAINLAKEIKNKYNFEVAFNVMYMSNWISNNKFLDFCSDLDGFVDYFYMVDSYGGIFQEDVEKIIRLVKSKTNIKLGFHGHNNLEMALSNTITAMNGGCSIIDATITGMGRGAGNLKTELLLMYFNSKGLLEIEFDLLSKTVSVFEDLNKKYRWGTNLPYMFSGAYSLPQKDVMEWIGLNRYSLNSIINALNNKKNVVKDNVKLKTLSPTNKFKTAIILGGGETSFMHKDGVKKIIEENKDICLIHAGIKNVISYSDIQCPKYFALVGVENMDIWEEYRDFDTEELKFVFPPFPRKMGTVTTKKINSISRELEKITFTNISSDSPLVIAIQTAIDLNVKNMYFLGFDGYDVSLDKNQFVLANENQCVIDDLLNNCDVEVTSITPTKYKNIPVKSLYSYL